MGVRLQITDDGDVMLHTGISPNAVTHADETSGHMPWFAVRVKAHFERTAASSLSARDFEAFVPTYTEKRRWSDRTKSTEFPLFPGYVFCRMDPAHRVPVLSSPGVIGIVSCGTELLPVSDEEIIAVQRAVAASVRLTPWPFLKAGQLVRVMRGALTDVEGFVITDNGACRLVIQISLLQRSVSLQIDRDAIQPVTSATYTRA